LTFYSDDVKICYNLSYNETTGKNVSYISIAIMQTALPRLIRGDRKGIENPSRPIESGRGRLAGFWRPGRFLFYWALVFILSFSFLYKLGFVPEGILEIGDSLTAESAGDAGSVPQNDAEIISGIEYVNADSLSPKIIIPALGLDTEIVMPASAELGVLNTALYRGPVHYPGSGSPGNVGNVFIFGHSSLLSVVHNQNFKIFNGLKDLKPKDVIRIRWNGREYWYGVTSVAIKKADDTNINLSTDKKLLTLSTCRIIGSKEDRYVVEAEFMRSYPLRIL